MRVILLFLLGTVLGQLPQLPGSDIVGFGYDGTTMENRGLPVTTVTWDDSYTWTNPIYTDLTYQVPLEFIVNDRVESLLVDGSIAYTNVSDYQMKQTTTVKHHGFLGFGSRSKTTIKYYHKYFEEDYSLSFTYQFHGWYEITLPPLPPPSLHPLTTMVVNALPKIWSGDRSSSEWQAYRNFISNFGTHYVSEAIMGGMVKMTSWYHKCFLSQFSGEWVEQQSGWSFLGIISEKDGNNQYNGNTTTQWNEFSQQEIQIHGGNGLLYKPNDYDQWIPSIKYNPDVIFYQVSLISDIIPDPTIQANMVSAVKDYFQEAANSADQLEKSLVPKDPHTRPSWCKAN